MNSEHRHRSRAAYREPRGPKPPAGQGQMILYLDFDGVLHHENVLWHPKRGAYLCAPAEHSLFQHAGLLEDILAPYPDLRIVLSTSWVLRYGYSRAGKRLPSGLRARVIGATFHTVMNLDTYLQLVRGRQVWADVARRLPRAWLALDDSYQDWPDWCLENLVRTHEVLGISDAAVQDELRHKLARMYRGEMGEQNRTLGG